MRVVCRKCNGTGYLKEYDYIDGGICFTCQGKGYLDESDFERLNSLT